MSESAARQARALTSAGAPLAQSQRAGSGRPRSLSTTNSSSSMSVPASPSGSRPPPTPHGSSSQSATPVPGLMSPPLTSAGTAGSATGSMTWGDDSATANVRVILRVRPLAPHEETKGMESVIDVVSKTDITVTVPDTGLSRPASKTFSFDHVCGPTTTQEQLFRSSGVTAMIDSAIDGFSTTVFAYGQTGSGKTHSMSGSEERLSQALLSPDTDGIIPRAAVYLFHRVAQRQRADANLCITLRASYSEIHNESVRDLLNADGGGASLPLRWNAEHGFFVENQVVVECQQLDDLVAVIAEGHLNRRVGAHELNQDSSRSHCLLTVHIESQLVDAADGSARTLLGKLTFVDLAGSERLKETKSVGDMRKETANINRSLFTLGKVISTLCDIATGKKPPATHVPYRDSTLSKLLMDSLGGSGLCLMLACCSPASAYLDETLSTLNYAARARNIKNKPSVHIDPREKLATQLRQEIRLLKLENAYLHQQLGTTPSAQSAAAAVAAARSVSASPVSSQPPPSPHMQGMSSMQLQHVQPHAQAQAQQQQQPMPLRSGLLSAGGTGFAAGHTSATSSPVQPTTGYGGSFGNGGGLASSSSAGMPSSGMGAPLPPSPHFVAAQQQLQLGTHAQQFVAKHNYDMQRQQGFAGPGGASALIEEMHHVIGKLREDLNQANANRAQTERQYRAVMHENQEMHRKIENLEHVFLSQNQRDGSGSRSSSAASNHASAGSAAPLSSASSSSFSPMVSATAGSENALGLRHAVPHLNFSSPPASSSSSQSASALMGAAVPTISPLSSRLQAGTSIIQNSRSLFGGGFATPTVTDAVHGAMGGKQSQYLASSSPAHYQQQPQQPQPYQQQRQHAHDGLISHAHSREPPHPQHAYLPQPPPSLAVAASPRSRAVSMGYPPPQSYAAAVKSPPRSADMSGARGLPPGASSSFSFSSPPPQAPHLPLQAMYPPSQGNAGGSFESATPIFSSSSSAAAPTTSFDAQGRAIPVAGRRAPFAVSQPPWSQQPSQPQQLQQNQYVQQSQRQLDDMGAHAGTQQAYFDRNHQQHQQWQQQQQPQQPYHAKPPTPNGEYMATQQNQWATVGGAAPQFPAHANSAPDYLRR